MIIPCRRFGKTVGLIFMGQTWPIKMGSITLKDEPICRPETSVCNCHSALRKVPTEQEFLFRRSQNDIQTSKCFFKYGVLVIRFSSQVVLDNCP